MGFFDKKEKMAGILSIDDSEEVHGLLEFVAKGMGFKFLSANSGEEGLKLAEKEQPVLILLDVNMPGISGLDTCLLLKKNSKTAHIPIIMCTSESIMRTVETAMDNGAAGYINKPFNLALVKQKIAKVLKIELPAAEAVPAAKRSVAEPAAPPQSPTIAPGAASQPQSSAAPQKLQLPPVTPHPCVKCKKCLVYVPQYKMYYCYACGSYPAVQPPPPAASKKCPGCGGELAFLHDQNEWYCLVCKK